jgi:hypothetical protein
MKSFLSSGGLQVITSSLYALMRDAPGNLNLELVKLFFDFFYLFFENNCEEIFDFFLESKRIGNILRLVSTITSLASHVFDLSEFIPVLYAAYFFRFSFLLQTYPLTFLLFPLLSHFSFLLSSPLFPCPSLLLTSNRQAH